MKHVDEHVEELWVCIYHRLVNRVTWHLNLI